MPSDSLLFSFLAFSLFACDPDGTEPDPTDDTAIDDTGSGEVECEDGVCVLTGTITEDLTLTADQQWLLRGGVFIGDDTTPTTLTIEPGTTIYGETSTGGMLVVRRSSKIMAQGTAEAPIVFTSSKAPGSRARGDWGGVIVNGRAPINACSDPKSSDCEAYGEGGTGWFGGSDADDNSGVISYVRVEFAGTLISPENELNGIAFQAVGRNTTIDHVQVHMNADDGIEFFGGTAEIKYALVTGVGDDGFDWTDGWTGSAQFVVVQQYADSGDNGIEADNNGDANDATPVSNPTLSHVTLVGSPDSDSSDVGALLREGTMGHLTNSLIVGFNDTCLNVDNDATWANVDAGTLMVDYTWISCATPTGEGIKGRSVEDFFLAGAGNAIQDPGLADPYNATAPDFAPGAGAQTGAVIPAGAFFDQADFLGGVDPAADWTAGWTTSEQN